MLVGVCVCFVQCERTVTTQLQWLSPGTDSSLLYFTNCQTFPSRFPFFQSLTFPELVVSPGAAFSANLTGGISTSVAVFCHELPHELGKSIAPRCEKNKTKHVIFSLHTRHCSLHLLNKSNKAALWGALQRVIHIMTTSTASHAKQLLFLLELKL